VSKTLFQKIADKEIPATLVYEDDQVVAFRDIHPQAPTHVLLVPRQPIPRLADATLTDQRLLGHLAVKARRPDSGSTEQVTVW
jgi:histidine triad (HIT) family protein